MAASRGCKRKRQKRTTRVSKRKQQSARNVSACISRQLSAWRAAATTAAWRRENNKQRQGIGDQSIHLQLLLPCALRTGNTSPRIGTRTRTAHLLTTPHLLHLAPHLPLLLRAADLCHALLPALHAHARLPAAPPHRRTPAACLPATVACVATTPLPHSSFTDASWRSLRSVNGAFVNNLLSRSVFSCVASLLPRLLRGRTRTADLAHSNARVYAVHIAFLCLVLRQPGIARCCARAS